MPHAVLQRIYHLSVREAQQLGTRIDDSDVGTGQDVNHGGVFDADHTSAHHDKRAGDTINPTPEQLYICIYLSVYLFQYLYHLF